MEKKDIIGMCGRAHSGKTMLSDYLIKKYGYKKVYFAQSLKEFCAVLLGFSSVDEMNKHKTEEKEYILNSKDIEHISTRTNIPYEVVLGEVESIKSVFKSVRHALQFIGTDLIRKYNPDWHVNELIQRIQKITHNKIIIDDVRFPNEVKVLEEMGAKLFFIVRPHLENVTHHASEESLTWQKFDNVIINNTTPKNALEQLETLLNNKVNEKFTEVFDNYYVPNLGEDKTVIVYKDDYNTLHISDKEFKSIYDTYIVDKTNPLVIEDLKRQLWYA